MSTRINYEPDYSCEYCGTYLHHKNIRHTAEVGNSAPKHFCSIGCYYRWASEGEVSSDIHEEYDR